MENERWHLHRACIVNYWYFDEAYFEFSKGKLLLRGANGSGKSITTASLLPLLLDGKTTPSRLDPFGSSSRKIEEYLLGEKDIAQYDDRTGYLVLEYKFGNSDVYFTSGLGIRARRGKSLDRWYFILTDNSRVGSDFPLWHDLGGNERRPYSERELSGRLATSGRLTKKQGEYAEWINKYLFAFDSMETFNQMIQLQLDIRKPKLSKDFAPTEIYRILEDALPQLKDEDLHEVSDSLENIETAKNQLQQAQSDLAELKELADAFETYHKQVQGKYAKRTLSIRKKAEEFKRNLQETSDQLIKAQQLLAAYKEKRTVLNSEIEILQEKINALQHHDIFRLEAELNRLQNEVQKQRMRFAELEKQAKNARTSQANYQQQLDRLELALARLNQQQEEFLAELDEHVEHTGFTEHDTLADDFKRLGYDMNVHYWKSELRKYREAFNEMVNEAHRLDHVNKQKEAILTMLNTLAKERERIEYDLKHYHEMFDTELTKTEVALGEWQKLLPFSFPESDWKAMLQRLNELFETVPSYEQVKEPLFTAYNNYQVEQTALMKEEKSSKRRLEKQLQQLQEELANWRQKKLPEPERRAEQLADRERLNSAGKNFVSFYEVIDFVADVPPAERAQLEAALFNSGILDAIVCEELLELENEQQLIPNPQWLIPTLADYLQPAVGETNISEGYVLDLLQSIALEKDAQAVTVIGLNGSYDLGIYRGKAGDSQKSQFIGKESQKRFLQEKVTAIEALIEDKEREIQISTDLILEIQERIIATKECFERIPDSKELQDIHQLISEQRRQLSDNQQSSMNQNQELQRISKQHKELYIKIRQFQTDHNLAVSEEIAELEQLRKQLKDYQAALEDLYDAFARGKSLPGQISQQQTFLADSHERQLLLAAEQQQVKQELANFNRRIQAIEEQLAIEGVEEIRNEIQTSMTQHQQKKQELTVLHEEKIPETTSRTDDLKKEVAQNQESSEFYQILYGCWLEITHREIRRYQTEWPPLTETAQYYQSDESLKKAAANLKRIQREKMFSLGQYSPELVESENIHFPDLENREWSMALISDIQLLQADSRNEILYLLDEQNRRTSVIAIYEQVHATIEEQQTFIDQEDQTLFEEILLNSIGNNIKGLISKTEQWVKKMNSILQNTKAENRLRLAIRWVPKTAENDREMNTADLVRILRQPASMLTTEDLERMISHFREKINYAKVLQEKSTEGDLHTLHEVMKEVLDYRHWFKFLLQYQKDDEPKRELTNPRFYKLSGGEKAVAMYLPLFTAMYARFEDAKADAPRMVCLDEAFAGVDELNIADLFGTLEDLGFDYLLNSQALWGDYDTVSSLNIYQLIRKANSTTVGIIRSHWNGKKKETLGDEDGTRT